MTYADAAHADDVLLSHVAVCDSEGVATVQSAHVKPDVISKFIRFMSHNVVFNKLLRLLKSHSAKQSYDTTKGGVQNCVFWHTQTF